MTEYEKTHEVAKSVEEAEKLFKEFKAETLSKFTILGRIKDLVGTPTGMLLLVVCYEYTTDIRKGLTYTFLNYFFFLFNKVIFKLIIFLLIILK